MNVFHPDAVFNGDDDARQEDCATQIYCESEPPPENWQKLSSVIQPIVEHLRLVCLS